MREDISTQTRLPPIVNKNLFSVHFLFKILPTKKEWGEDKKIKDVFEKIKKLYAEQKKLLDKYKESQLEDHFIKPIFGYLGHYFEIQETTHETGKQPDYAFFPDDKTRREAHSNKGKISFYTKAVAVGDAKSWELPLDKKTMGGASFDKQNPSFQIDTYLRDTEPKWAILTNGRYWRIYFEETSYKLNSYFEVDLVDIINRDDLESFKYFYFFFGLEAFLIDEKGRNFLDQVYEGSVNYARELGENLQENVYNALKILAEGFLNLAENKLEKTPETIKQIHGNALVFLYRVLFALYSESRGLLDISNEKYARTFSFYSIKHEVTEKIDKGEEFQGWYTNYWNRLKNLFSLINEGSESKRIPKKELFIPSYNGGLFDPSKHEFLEKYAVGDAYLSKVINLLSRSNGGFIDYSTLDIRHLGSIYEGLLEFKLKIAEEDIVSVTEKGKEIWVPQDKAGERKIHDEVEKGGLYLVTDKGERKATGSYYTPGYIVKYIVKNTLGPVVEQKIKEAREAGNNESEAILSTKVLDPAMGSGHFLVEAVDFLARALLEAVSNDINKGLLPEAEYSTEWAKREIVSHCIYGVDLNPLAVELAKLSLWLATIAKDKPLSFVDHRLKCGNSLIGTNLEDLPWHPEKKILDKKQKRIDISGFVKILGDITKKLSEIRDDTLDNIKQKGKIFEELKKTLAYNMMKTLADVRTSIYFGNHVDETTYGNYSGDAGFSKSEEEWKMKQGKAAYRIFVQKAKEIVEEKRFFHWKLEFPEVFFEAGKKKENPGFDAVVGNPPYFSAIRVPDGDLGYLSEKYGDLWAARNDISYYFYVDFVSYLRQGGFIGFIFPRYYLDAHYAVSFREFLTETTKLVELVDTGNYQVFEGVNILTTILIAQVGFAPPDHIFNYNVCLLDHSNIHVERSYQIRQEHLKGRRWQINVLVQEGLFDRLMSKTVSLGELVEIGKGMSTGFNNAFELDTQAAKQKFGDKRFLRDLIKNGDIRKYFVKDERRKVIYLENIKRIEDFPEYAQYLKNFEAQLRKRRNYDGPWYKYSTPRNKELWERLGTKIVVPFMATENRFAIESRPVISTSGDVNVLFLKDGTQYSIFYLLALLNSKVLEFYHINTTKLKREGYMEYITKQLTKLPIRRILFTTLSDRRTALLEEVKQIYQKYLVTKDQKPMLDFVKTCLPKDDNGNLITGREQSDVVHDFLTYLAEQMIEINKSKNEEIRTFLEWVEREIGVKIEILTNRTKLKQYHAIDFDELLGILKKNKEKIPINLSDRGFQNNLKREFEKSTMIISLLKNKIELTDKLIDQIVYRLYGLTDKEIRILESSVRVGGLLEGEENMGVVS
jgi:hypothetical protein